MSIKVAKSESDIFNYLISNKGFIDWVRNPNESSDYFWDKWVEEQPNYTKDIIRAREFVERMQFNDEKLTEDELGELLGKIIKKEKTDILIEERSKRVFQPNLKWIFKYAAIFFIVFATTFSIYYFNSSFNTDANTLVAEIVEWEIVSNPRGKRSKVTLPDGTVVDLNYESTLKYPKKFNQKIRQVELKGEAFFDVYHMDDNPFIVKTGVLETEVFGTSFNINSFDRNDRLDVSLVTGKVKIKNTFEDDTQGVSSVLLAPGEQLSYNKISHEMVKNVFDLENTIAWKDGSIIFEDIGFKEFISRLERWYGVNFQIYGNPPKNWRFNGRYQDEKIENILIGIKFVYQLDYNIQDKNIIIKFK